MRIKSVVLMVMAALLIFSGDALAKGPGTGQGGGGGSGDDVSSPPDYGDLIKLYRDVNGVPYPSKSDQVADPETDLLVDGGLCWQPIAFNYSVPANPEDLCPDYCVVTSDPFGAAVVDVNQYNCGVAEGCSGCTQEVDFGRMNSARAPQSVFDSQLEDVVNKLATADCITLDPAGRLVASTVTTVSTATDETGVTAVGSDYITGMTDTSDFIVGDIITVSAGFLDEEISIIAIDATEIQVSSDADTTATDVIVTAITESVLTSTIDSPLQNLAIYKKLMEDGFLGDVADTITLPASFLDTAARGLGVASDKGGEVNVDMLAYLNSIMGLDDDPTILGKLCETYREEVQGVIVPDVVKCYLNYGNVTSDIAPPGANYGYTRSSNFSGNGGGPNVGLPNPPYIPEAAVKNGWFEYLAEIDLQQTPPLPPLFQIKQGLITTAVFEDEPGFEDGNIDGFAQAADDTRAVINYMHDWPMPDADVFGTPVVCEASDDDSFYDLSISEESGLQVPKNYVNGGEREFFVNVANLGPDTAYGTVTVNATTNGETLDCGLVVTDCTWTLGIGELLAGQTASSTVFFTITTSSDTINWTATVVADPPENDTNSSNNSVSADSSVRASGGGSGGGGGGGGGGGTP